MAQDNFTEDLAEARAAYFRKGEELADKIHRKFGSGREGFLNFLNNNDVESVKPQKQDPS